MRCRPHQVCALALLAAWLLAAAPAYSPAFAFERGDNQFPNSIMAPERGGRVRPYEPWLTPQLRGQPRVRFSPGNYALPHAPHAYASSPATIPSVGVASGLTIVPGAGGLGPVPNLPPAPGLAHETFQDRASRCAFQAGLYGVPNGASNQYMSACSM
jgi:hypothetical protein